MNKKILKRLLSIIFILIIIASSLILFLDLTKKEEPNPIYDDPPEEIIVDDEDKEDVVVEEDKDPIKLSPDVDLAQERLNHNNDDIIGRLEIPNLFNILIVRGKDNSYYLNYSIDRTWDVRGSEFMDYRLTPTSKQINIYGHNSRDENIKVPFLKLESFLNKTFFDENQYIIFQYDGGKSYYKIMAIKEITTDYEHMTLDKTGAEFVEHVNKLKDNSIYTRDVYYDENSEIMILQTCSHHLDNAYYIITAVKISAIE